MRGIALCALALLAAACSQATPTPYPTSTPWIVTATPGPTSTPWIVTPTPRPTVRPTATPAPEAGFIPPTPSGPGICGRTPEVQQALIETLKIASCRLITEHELYRIRDLPDIRAPELKAGDFAGLVNLESLSVEVWRSEDGAPAVIPAGAFADSRIKHLQISSPPNSSSHVTIEDGAFDGAYVEGLAVSLAVRGPIYDRQGEITGYRSPGRLPDRLPESLIRLSVGGDLRSLDWRIFRTLPELETLSLTHDQGRPGPEGTATPYVIALPIDAFASNPKLQALELKADSSWGTGSYQIDAGLLSEHEHLGQVFIAGLDIRGPKPDGLPIRLHPDSPAASHVAEQGTREWNDWRGGRDFRLP